MVEIVKRKLVESIDADTCVLIMQSCPTAVLACLQYTYMHACMHTVLSYTQETRVRTHTDTYRQERSVRRHGDMQIVYEC